MCMPYKPWPPRDEFDCFTTRYFFSLYPPDYASLDNTLEKIFIQEIETLPMPEVINWLRIVQVISPLYYGLKEIEKRLEKLNVDLREILKEET